MIDMEKLFPTEGNLREKSWKREWLEQGNLTDRLCTDAENLRKAYEELASGNARMRLPEQKQIKLLEQIYESAAAIEQKISAMNAVSVQKFFPENETILHPELPVPIVFMKIQPTLLLLRCPLPNRKISSRHPKLAANREANFEHTSNFRELIRVELQKNKAWFQAFDGTMSVHFLFMYAQKKQSVPDHDNLKTAGILDEISRASGIDDNGIRIFTSYKSAISETLPPATYILLSSQIAPMPTLTEHLQYAAFSTKKL